MKELEFDPTNAETLDQFRKIPAFAALTEEQVRQVVAASRIRRYDAGELVIREGEYDAWVFFLVRGELKITHKGVEVGRIRRLGDVFGEMGVIDGSPRSASIQALTPSLCLAVDGALLDRPPPEETCMLQTILYRIFCEMLAVRLRDMDAKLTELTSKMGH